MIGGAPKPAVVQTLSAVPDRGSQPCFQAAITETKKEPPPTFSQVSPTRPSFDLLPPVTFHAAKKTGSDIQYTVDQVFCIITTTALLKYLSK